MLRNALHPFPLRHSSVSTKLFTRSVGSPQSSSSHHSSLASFLIHAHTTGLSIKSSLYNGTLYEYVCLETLSSPAYGFSLTRVGQRNDAGVDLIGEWTPPVSLPPKKTSSRSHSDEGFPFPLRVLVQCKSSRNKLSPNVVRELEGCIAGAPAGWRGENTLAVLCAKREASKGVRDAVRDAGMGVVWIMVEDGEGSETLRESGELTQKNEAPDDVSDDSKPIEEKTWLEEVKNTKTPVGRVRQMLWNQRAADIGLEAVKVGMKYVDGKAGGEMSREVKLLGIGN